MGAPRAKADWPRADACGPDVRMGPVPARGVLIPTSHIPRPPCGRESATMMSSPLQQRVDESTATLRVAYQVRPSVHFLLPGRIAEKPGRNAVRQPPRGSLCEMLRGQRLGLHLRDTTFDCPFQVAQEAFSDGLLSAEELDATKAELQQTYREQLHSLGIDASTLPDPTTLETRGAKARATTLLYPALAGCGCGVRENHN